MACVLWLASKLLRGVLSLSFLSTVGTGLVPRGSVFLGLCSNQQTSYFSGHKSWWLLWCWRSWDHRSQGLDLWTQPGQHWTMLWVQPLLSFQNIICVHIAQAYALRNKHTHTQRLVFSFWANQIHVSYMYHVYYMVIIVALLLACGVVIWMPGTWKLSLFFAYLLEEDQTCKS